jgi:hypothetical protein
VSIGVYVAAGRAGSVGLETSIVSGATISSVHYRLNETNPSRIDVVTLSVRPALPRGRISVQAAGHAYRCRLVSAGTRAVCRTTTPQLTAQRLTTLGIVAAG